MPLEVQIEGLFIRLGPLQASRMAISWKKDGGQGKRAKKEREEIYGDYSSLPNDPITFYIPPTYNGS